MELLWSEFTVVFGLLYFSTHTSSATKTLILSPLINQGHIEAAQNASLVDPNLFLNMTSHSGFLTVDGKYNSNLFFWYFPVQNRDLEKTPLIVWLQGGPGSSSLYGVFDEIGPFSYDGQELKLREHWWGKDHSLLFIDNPVGTGYSFTDSDEGYATTMATYSSHLYTAVQQFLTLFPRLRTAPVFLAGESYAGHYVPALAAEILTKRPQGNLTINLQGLMMGNPILDREDIANQSSLFYQWGLIDSQGVAAVRKLQEAYYDAIRRDDHYAARKFRNQLLDKLYDISFQQQNYNLLKDDLDDEIRRYKKFIERPEVKIALHTGSKVFDSTKQKAVTKLIPEFLSHMRPIVENLLEHYRILIYCGQLDLIAPCTASSEARRRSWHWGLREEFMSAPRTPWWYDNRVAGYVKSGGRLTEVLVRGAGHLVPFDLPAPAQQLISYFIRNLDLPQPINYHPVPTDTATYENIEIETPEQSTGTKSVMIVSLLFNALFVCGIVAGVVIYRLRSRKDSYRSFLTDGVLNLS